MPSHTDIVKDRVPGQKSLLKDKRDMLKERFIANAFNIFPSDQNLSLVHIMETGNQCGNRTFPCPGCAYNGNLFAIPDGQVGIFQHIYFPVIGKAHVF